MSDKPVPNPFEAARRIAALSVMLQSHDLTDAWPTLTEMQARRVLDLHRSSIAVQMLAAGVQAALTILRQEGAIS